MSFSATYTAPFPARPSLASSAALACSRVYTEGSMSAPHGPQPVEYTGQLGNAQAHGLQLVPVLEHLPGRALKRDLPVVHHHQAVHRPGHLLHGVGHQDDGGVVGPVIVPDVGQDGSPRPPGQGPRWARPESAPPAPWQ